MILLILFLSSNFAFSQTDTEKIHVCLKALYKDQYQFVRSSGHYAAHVDLLENSDKQACFGIQLKLSRQTVQDYKIQGSKNDEVWQIDQNKKLQKVKQDQ